MTLPIFPTLPGITWPAKRSPGFRNVVQTGLTGRRTVGRFQTAPRWSYELQVEFLRNFGGHTEFNDLLALWLQCNGSFGTFLFEDLGDNVAVNHQIGVGNGTATQFFLTRALAGFDERVISVNGTPTIYVNGVAFLPSFYTIDTSGIVTFTSAVPAGQPVAWSGYYRWICRFDDDQLDLSQFMSNWWEVKSLKFSTEVILG